MQTAKTNNKPPGDDYTNNIDSMRVTGDSLAERANDDNHEFDTIFSERSV
jgi:hypothetical protein